MRDKILTNIEHLQKYLAKIDKVFSINELLTGQWDTLNIATYYANSSLGYKFFHSYQGAVHMALNYDGVFDKDGYLTQAKEVSQFITERDYAAVLELGCGKGFNSCYLAKSLPQVRFQGIDITHQHLSIAKKSGAGLSNLTFSYGDFHDLEFSSETFDLVFEIEALCHAIDHKKALKSIYESLKPSGSFILYEGFRKQGFNQIPEDLRIAALLAEKAMAVNDSLEIEDWLALAKQAGFKVKSCEDLSAAIMPNLGKLQRLARGFFRYKILSKAFLFFLPKDLVMNAIAGLLMPFTIKNNAHGYYRIILEK